MVKPVEPPVITSKEQLRALLIDFTPTNQGQDDSFRVEVDDENKPQFIVSPGTGSQNAKTLIEGFQMVRNRKEYNEQLGSGLNIDDMTFWVDNMIRDKLGGTRKGDKIIWEIDGEIVTYDPFTGELT